MSKNYLKIKNKFLSLEKRGFTLIEMIIYMSVLSVFLVVLTDIFVSALDVQTESEATSAVYQNGHFLISRLMYDVNRAQSIAIPASLGEETTSLQITINGISYTYSLSSGTINLINDYGINNLNSFNTVISDLSFRRLGNLGGKNNIRVSFTIQSKTERSGGPEVKTFQTTVGLR